MGFRVARKHRLRLRGIVQMMFAASVTLSLLGLLLPAIAAIPLTFAALAALTALLIERWLIFAEATHTVALYYSGHA
jgi:DMSO reductase anchor subunit